MNGIILDTNVISELMRFQPDPLVVGWFARQTALNFYVTAITQSEILLGVALLPAGKRRDVLSEAAGKMFREDFLGNCLPFDESCAALYASVVAHRRRSGFSVTTEDAQIVAIALSRKLPLATRNAKDFLHIADLMLHNPWAEI
jgi:predicted nucleic acid-binding protein